MSRFFIVFCEKSLWSADGWIFSRRCAEVLNDPAVTARLADTKALGEVRALDDFYAMLQHDSDRAFYGWGADNKAKLSLPRILPHWHPHHSIITFSFSPSWYPHWHPHHYSLITHSDGIINRDLVRVCMYFQHLQTLKIPTSLRKRIFSASYIQISSMPAAGRLEEQALCIKPLSS